MKFPHQIKKVEEIGNFQDQNNQTLNLDQDLALNNQVSDLDNIEVAGTSKPIQRKKTDKFKRMTKYFDEFISFVLEEPTAAEEKEWSFFPTLEPPNNNPQNWNMLTNDDIRTPFEPRYEYRASSATHGEGVNDFLRVVQDNKSSADGGQICVFTGSDISLTLSSSDLQIRQKEHAPCLMGIGSRCTQLI